MARNRFDQASRYAAKLDPPGFLTWLGCDPGLIFRGWLDTRTLPFPGDPDRTCDTVAWLEDALHQHHWAIIIEFNLVADAQMFGRLLVYLGQFWLERRPEAGDRFQVAAAVVNLTGQGRTSQDMRLGTFRTCLQVAERDLANEDGAMLLDAVEAGTVTRAILPWIPLLRGGNDPAMITKWQELASVEPDRQRKADFGGLALVFAEAAGRRGIWKEALKEWNMAESQQVLEWIAEGELKGKAETLLHMLAKKFPPGPSPDLAAIIQSCKDSALLSRWVDAALDAKNLDEFRRALLPEQRNGA